MLPLRLQHFAIRLQRGQHSFRLRARHPRQSRLNLPEAARCPRLAARSHRELSQRVQRRGPLGLQQRIVHRLHRSDAMHLEPSHFEARHLGKSAHLGAVALDARLHGLPGRGLLVIRFAPRQHQRRGHALQIPLKRSANGLVEIVDVEHQPAVGRGKRAQVAHVRIAAQLAQDARIGQRGQVRRHHWRCAAKIAKGRLRHELVFKFQQRRNASAFHPLQQRQGRPLPRLDVQFVMMLAANLFASCLAQLATLFRTCPVHVREHTPSGFPAQPGSPPPLARCCRPLQAAGKRPRDEGCGLQPVHRRSR